MITYGKLIRCLHCHRNLLIKHSEFSSQLIFLLSFMTNESEFYTQLCLNILCLSQTECKFNSRFVFNILLIEKVTNQCLGPV